VTPIQRAAGGMLRIQEVLDAEDEVVDAAGARPLPPFSQAIEFRGVSYRYGDASPVLAGVTTTIRAGESVTVVGPSGSGKSTLLGLLLRLHDPVSGAIAIDGHDLRKVTQVSLRMQMGVVFQDSVLFNTTLRENIRLGKPEADDNAVEAAAREAGIHEFIVSLPEGYGTRAGGGGAALSGGERQRVALARALIRRPAILVLDEPVSALDAQAEAAMNRTLEQIARGRTVIAVSHRLAPSSSRLLVFSGGRLVEDGRHDQLLALGGVYAELWRAQNQTVSSRSLADATIDPISSP
jgi:ATP-binding cassette subfamily B protein